MSYLWNLARSELIFVCLFSITALVAAATVTWWGNKDDVG